MTFGRSGGTRKSGSTVAESLVVVFDRVVTHQIRRRRGAARSSMSQGRAETLCAKIKGANREISEGKLMSDHGLLSFYEGHKARANGPNSWGFFEDAQGFGRLGAGSRASFTSSSPPPHHGPRYFNFLIFVRCVILKNLDFLIKTGWTVICPLCCRERWSWVGDNNPSRCGV